MASGGKPTTTPRSLFQHPPYANGGGPASPRSRLAGARRHRGAAAVRGRPCARVGLGGPCSFWVGSSVAREGLRRRENSRGDPAEFWRARPLKHMAPQALGASVAKILSHLCFCIGSERVFGAVCEFFGPACWRAAAVIKGPRLYHRVCRCAPFNFWPFVLLMVCRGTS